MNKSSPDAENTNAFNLSRSDATRMLPIAIAGPRRPVDAVLERLCRSDASGWIGSMQNMVAQHVDGFERLADRALLADSSASMDQLRSLKDWSKAEMSESDPENPPAMYVFLYFFAVASAMVHHGMPLSSTPRHVLDPILVDLADAAPSPWSELFLHAAMKDL